MKIAIWAGHVGSNSLVPSGQHGGGELHTFAFLDILSKKYDVTAILSNGVYPGFDKASDYGFDLSDINWRPVGDSIDWLQGFDVLMSMNHGNMIPPICRRNILVPFFPQYPQWDVSGYDTIIANSKFSAKWIKNYWGRDADVVYPPILVKQIMEQTQGYVKSKQILCVGRFFNVPGGNNKNHLVVLHAFKHLMRHDWRLVFVGAVQDKKYYQEVRDAAKDDDRIYFLHDISREAFLKVIAESAFVWSATGYEAQKPSSMEHFGTFTIEAMATGGIPMVHNSGGAPESGAITWDTPKDLIRLTNEILEDPETLRQAAAKMLNSAQDFDIEKMGQQLIDVIEKPIVLNNLDSQLRVYPGDPTPVDVKVGYISDGHDTTTGFGTVTKSVITGLVGMGFRVVNFAMQSPMVGRGPLTPPDIEQVIRDTIKEIPDLSQWTPDDIADDIMEQLKELELCTTWRGCPHDINGWQNLQHFIADERPDILYINYDPGNVRQIIEKLRSIKCDLPLVVYMPIEGKPVIAQYIETLRLIKVLNGQTILYTKAGRDFVLEAGGPRCKYVHHGVDHANFKPLDPEDRDKFRFAVGWQNKTVLMTLGRNKRTKGFGTALFTAKILKDRGFDFVWYLHTDVNDQMENSSMPLEQIALDLGVSDRIFFPNLVQTKGISYDKPTIMGSVPDTDSIQQTRRLNLATLSLIELYGIADIYVDPSELEGFGLPPLEAAGCGLPIISIDDKGIKQEVLGEAPIYVPVTHWDTSWHTGAWLAQANPTDFADAIMAVADDDKLRQELVEASLKRYQDFPWEKTVEVIAEAIMEQV